MIFKDANSSVYRIANSRKNLPNPDHHNYQLVTKVLGSVTYLFFYDYPSHEDILPFLGIEIEEDLGWSTIQELPEEFMYTGRRIVLANELNKILYSKYLKENYKRNLTNL